jgi:hypothetical protein
MDREMSDYEKAIKVLDLALAGAIEAALGDGRDVDDVYEEVFEYFEKFETKLMAGDLN